PENLSGDPRARSGARRSRHERAPAARPDRTGVGSRNGKASLMAFASLDLSGRTAVVVGGTTGIGRALTVGLAQAGADVVPTSRRKDAVDEAAALVEAAGRRTLRVTTDVANEASIAALLAAA